MITMIRPEIAEDVSELLEYLLEMPCDTICTWMMNMKIFIHECSCALLINTIDYEGEVDVRRVQSDSDSMFTFMFTEKGASYEFTRGWITSGIPSILFHVGQSRDTASVHFKTRMG